MAKDINDYYQNCAFPKPAMTKKQKKVNGYKDKPNRVCWYCGERNAERHEVFNGPYRQASIDMGFQVDVCPVHHRRLHESGRPFGKIETLKWRMFYQKEYEEKLIATGISESDARELWVHMMGKNYL